jgi:hypothetical protein
MMSRSPRRLTTPSRRQRILREVYHSRPQLATQQCRTLWLTGARGFPSRRSCHSNRVYRSALASFLSACDRCCVCFMSCPSQLIVVPHRQRSSAGKGRHKSSTQYQYQRLQPQAAIRATVCTNTTYQRRIGSWAGGDSPFSPLGLLRAIVSYQVAIEIEARGDCHMY